MAYGLPDYEDGARLPVYEQIGSPLEASASPALPPTFRIGEKGYTTPLISPPQVRAHLLLLGAFCTLKEQVLATESLVDPNMRSDVKWTLFLTRAALRFEAWVLHVVKSRPRTRGEIVQLKDYEIPPLDVLLCYHAYFLSPFAYFHDCEAMHPELRLIGGFPFEAVAFRIHPETFEYQPSIIQIEEWELATRQEFEPPLATSFECSVELDCPRCGTVAKCPVLTQISEESGKGTGYAQTSFGPECSFCGLRITRDVFAANNIARDMGRASKDLSVGQKTFLVGNLLGAKGKLAPEVANHFPRLIIRALETPEVASAPNKRVAYGDHFRWNTGRAQWLIEQSLTRPGEAPRTWQGDLALYWRSLRRSMRSWRQPHPFSFDIVGSVMRQFKFSEQVHALGWTSPHYLNTHPSVIVDSIIQYHAFVELCGQTFRELVPTLSIDLAWHTHMLRGDQYRLDMLRLVDRFIDHDDKVEEGSLAQAFEDTKQQWKNRFKTDYPQALSEPSASAKLLQSQSTVSPLGATLSAKRLSQFLSFGKRSNSVPTFAASIDRSTPSLIPPILSTHNSVLVLGGNQMLQEKREAREATFSKKLAKAVEKEARLRGERPRSRFGVRRLDRSTGEVEESQRSQSRASMSGASSSGSGVPEIVTTLADSGTDEEPAVGLHQEAPRSRRRLSRLLSTPASRADLPVSRGPTPGPIARRSDSPELLSPDDNESRAPTPSPQSRRGSLVPTSSQEPSQSDGTETDRLFLRPMPAEGVDVVNFKSLGAAGWDLWGPRECTVLDGNQRRGDCCTGAQLSCSTSPRYGVSTTDWSLHYGSYGWSNPHSTQTAVPITTA